MTVAPPAETTPVSRLEAPMEILATAESLAAQSTAKAAAFRNPLGWARDVRRLALDVQPDPSYESPTTFVSPLAPPNGAPQLPDETSLHASPDEYSHRHPTDPSQETNSKPDIAPSSAPCDSLPTRQSSI